MTPQTLLNDHEFTGAVATYPLAALSQGYADAPLQRIDEALLLGRTTRVAEYLGHLLCTEEEVLTLDGAVSVHVELVEEQCVLPESEVPWLLIHRGLILLEIPPPSGTAEARNIRNLCPSRKTLIRPSTCSLPGAAH